MASILNSEKSPLVSSSELWALKTHASESNPRPGDAEAKKSQTQQFISHLQQGNDPVPPNLNEKSKLVQSNASPIQARVPLQEHHPIQGQPDYIPHQRFSESLTSRPDGKKRPTSSLQTKAQEAHTKQVAITDSSATHQSRKTPSQKNVPESKAATSEQLKTLNFVSGGRDALIEESPILALLSDHLEHVSAETLPSLLASSTLMQNILGSTDILNEFQTPLSLDKILSLLGVQMSDLSKAVEELGLGQEQTTVEDVLTALGFDMQKIEQEANYLRDILQSDGLSSLMVRSAKVRAQRQSEEQAAIAQAASQVQVLNPPTTEKDGSPLNKDYSQNLAKVTLGSDQEISGQNLLNAQLWGLDPQQNVLLPFEPDTFNTTASTSLPTVSLATADVFAALTEQWQPEDIKSYIFTNDTKAPALPGIEALVGNDPNVFSSSSEPAPTISNLADSLGLFAHSDEASSDRGNPQPSNQEDFNQSSQNSTPLFMSQAFQKADSNSNFQIQMNPLTQPSPTGPSAEALQKIFDSASMMVKEGGGSIRIDLGSDALGSVDLALDIKDKTIELRIITSSAQTRELLSQDLPKLKDSLLQQNLNLEKVEIGVGGGSAWSQASSDGRSSYQGFEWTEQKNYQGPRGTSRVRTYRQSNTDRNMSSGPLHSGLIQVRV